MTDNTNAREALAQVIGGPFWGDLSLPCSPASKIGRALSSADAVLAWLSTAGWTPPEAPQQRQERGGAEIDTFVVCACGDTDCVGEVELHSPAPPSADTRPAPEAGATGVTCDPCVGTGRDGWRTCRVCGGSGRVADPALAPLSAATPAAAGEGGELRSRVIAAVKLRLDMHPALDASQSRVKEIRAGWIADDVLAALRASGKPGEA